MSKESDKIFWNALEKSQHILEEIIADPEVMMYSILSDYDGVYDEDFMKNYTQRVLLEVKQILKIQQAVKDGLESGTKE